MQEPIAVTATASKLLAPCCCAELAIPSPESAVPECTLALCLRLGCCLWLPELAERKGGWAHGAAPRGEALAPACPLAWRCLLWAEPVPGCAEAAPHPTHISLLFEFFWLKGCLVACGMQPAQPLLLLLLLAGCGPMSPQCETLIKSIHCSERNSWTCPFPASSTAQCTRTAAHSASHPAANRLHSEPAKVAKASRLACSQKEAVLGLSILSDISSP